MELLEASAEPAGRTVFRYTVQPEHCNRLGNLHGGCTSTIFDVSFLAYLYGERELINLCSG